VRGISSPDIPSIAEATADSVNPMTNNAGLVS
jgi:hypothetical protein